MTAFLVAAQAEDVLEPPALDLEPPDPGMLDLDPDRDGSDWLDLDRDLGPEGLVGLEASLWGRTERLLPFGPDLCGVARFAITKH